VLRRLGQKLFKNLTRFLVPPLIEPGGGEAEPCTVGFGAGGVLVEKTLIFLGGQVELTLAGEAPP
jgi:hypothetical protein